MKPNYPRRWLLFLGIFAVIYFLYMQLTSKTNASVSIFQDSEKENEEHRKDVNRRILFFNRIPKTGSEMFVHLLQWLQMRNGFKHIRLQNSVKRYLSTEQQLELAKEISSHEASAPGSRLSFDRHVHFTNFSSLGSEAPLLFNVVRDPVEKIISRFYYSRIKPKPGAPRPPNYRPPKPRPFNTIEECLLNNGDECTYKTGYPFDLTIPYLCGHEMYCRLLNNKRALNEAKKNVDRSFSVVGVLEEMNATLSVLENVLPEFFRGVVAVYHDELGGFRMNKNVNKPKIEDWVYQTLKSSLSMEYELYEMVRRRLLLKNAEFKRIKIK